MDSVQITGLTSRYDRFMQSIGNIHTQPFAGLTIPSFGTTLNNQPTRILQFTADAEMLYGARAASVMPFAQAVTKFTIRAFRFMDEGLPLVQQILENSEADEETARAKGREWSTGWSPYNPAVWKLRSESKGSVALSDAPNGSAPSASLRSAAFLSPSRTLVHLEWEIHSSTPLRIQPGQHVIMDMRAWLSTHVGTYTHMARFRGGEQALNDDGIRSYTVSRIYEPVREEEGGGWATRFGVTLRKAESGAVTRRLFDAVGRAVDSGGDVREAGIEAPLLGVGGEFLLPTSEEKAMRVVYIANGIGMTPVLAHLQSLAVQYSNNKGTLGPGVEVVLIIATRPGELELTENCIREALSPILDNTTSQTINFHVQLLSSGSAGDSSAPLASSNAIVSFERSYNSRLTETSLLPGNFLPNGFDDSTASLANTHAFVCGSKGFATIAKATLRAANVPAVQVYSEDFGY